MHAVFLQKLEMLTPVHNNANDADDPNNANDMDDDNRVIGIALLNAFSCAKKQNKKLQVK